MVGSYPEEDQSRVRSAVRWSEELHAGQRRASGEPYIIHPLNVAETLLNLRLDPPTVIAALLHDVLEDTGVGRDEVESRFGPKVTQLVEGVTKITMLRAKSRSTQSAESIRKMLFAMVKDIRVILIKLADKLHNMKTLHYLEPERQRQIARECLEIYAPLAGRLGISWIKDELEDLSLKVLQPGAYLQIRSYVAERRSRRADYLEGIERAITEAAAKEGIEVEILARAKHFYSIYQKMKRRGKGLDEIYDLLGIRILCEGTVECYTLLGLVHDLWKPIAGRFKDYIAMPKSNRYQSLHTTVMGNDGRLIEIQIRTYAMNQTAEYGIAAHWLYKHGRGNTRPEDVRPEDLSIINKLRSWNSGDGSSDFLSEIKDELLKDSIYVFTPSGDVIELPKGSTPIDFAYHIHTDIGNHIRAAKADGNIIPLRRALRNTQVVEIITSAKARPHLSWLRFVKTHRSRTKIRQWLNKNDRSVIIDRNIVVKKERTGLRGLERRAPAAPPAGSETEEKADTGPRGLQYLDRSRVGIRIGDQRNVMIRIARCCEPSTGDRIVGYVSRGRGIIVHRASCPNLAFIKDFEERHIDVEWETISPRATRRFRVTARRSTDLFSEIEGALKKYQGHLIAGKLHPNEKGALTGTFTVEIDRSEAFARVLKDLRTIPAVLDIHQMRGKPAV